MRWNEVHKIGPERHFKAAFKSRDLVESEEGYDDEPLMGKQVIAVKW